MPACKGPLTHNVPKLISNAVRDCVQCVHCVQCVQCVQCVHCLKCVHCVHFVDCVHCVRCVQCVRCAQCVHCVQCVCESVCTHRSGDGPTCSLPRPGLILSRDLSIFLQKSQRCLLPTRKLLITSVIVSFLLLSAKDFFPETS